MPRDKHHTIENSVFETEDLTFAIIKLQGYTRGETGGPSGDSFPMRFLVLYIDVVVAVNSEGLRTECLFKASAALSTK